MAVTIFTGLQPQTTEPLDSRMIAADEAARFGLLSNIIYEGLIVYQEDNDTLYVLTDTTNVGNDNGWTQLGSGGGGGDSANNATITIEAGDGLTGGGSFTTDQATQETITLDVSLSSGDIPDLPASQITSGQFNTNRIPDLDASIIASGNINFARLGTNTPTNNQVLAYNGQNNTLEWKDELAANAVISSVGTNVDDILEISNNTLQSPDLGNADRIIGWDADGDGANTGKITPLTHQQAILATGLPSLPDGTGSTQNKILRITGVAGDPTYAWEDEDVAEGVSYTFEKDSVALSSQSNVNKINFIGAGVTAVIDTNDDTTLDVTISGGGGGGGTDLQIYEGTNLETSAATRLIFNNLDFNLSENNNQVTIDTVDKVSGNNDGTNWTSITIDALTYTIPGDTTYQAGDGLDLLNGEFSVDNTVVRTNGDQSIGGIKTFSSAPTVLNSSGGQINLRSTGNTGTLGKVNFQETFGSLAVTEAEIEAVDSNDDIDIIFRSRQNGQQVLEKFRIYSEGALGLHELTTSDRNSLTAVEGMLIYNTSDNEVQYYNGSSWESSGGGGGDSYTDADAISALENATEVDFNGAVTFTHVDNDNGPVKIISADNVVDFGDIKLEFDLHPDLGSDVPVGYLSSADLYLRSSWTSTQPGRQLPQITGQTGGWTTNSSFTDQMVYDFQSTVGTDTLSGGRMALQTRVRSGNAAEGDSQWIFTTRSGGTPTTKFTIGNDDVTTNVNHNFSSGIDVTGTSNLIDAVNLATSTDSNSAVTIGNSSQDSLDVNATTAFQNQVTIHNGAGQLNVYGQATFADLVQLGENSDSVGIDNFRDASTASLQLSRGTIETGWNVAGGSTFSNTLFTGEDFSDWADSGEDARKDYIVTGIPGASAINLNYDSVFDSNDGWIVSTTEELIRTRDIGSDTIGEVVRSNEIYGRRANTDTDTGDIIHKTQVRQTADEFIVSYNTDNNDDFDSDDVLLSVANDQTNIYGHADFIRDGASVLETYDSTSVGTTGTKGIIRFTSNDTSGTKHDFAEIRSEVGGVLSNNVTDGEIKIRTRGTSLADTLSIQHDRTTVHNLLRLHSRGSDPAVADSEDGDIYYHTNDDVVRLHAAGVWTNLGTGSGGGGGLDKYSDSDTYTQDDVVWFDDDDKIYVWNSSTDSVAGTDPSESNDWVALSEESTVTANPGSGSTLSTIGINGTNYTIVGTNSGSSAFTTDVTVSNADPHLDLITTGTQSDDNNLGEVRWIGNGNHYAKIRAVQTDVSANDQSGQMNFTVLDNGIDWEWCNVEGKNANGDRKIIFGGNTTNETVAIQALFGAEGDAQFGLTDDGTTNTLYGSLAIEKATGGTTTGNLGVEGTTTLGSSTIADISDTTNADKVDVSQSLFDQVLRTYADKNTLNNQNPFEIINYHELSSINTNDGSDLDGNVAWVQDWRTEWADYNGLDYAIAGGSGNANDTTFITSKVSNTYENIDNVSGQRSGMRRDDYFGLRDSREAQSNPWKELLRITTTPTEFTISQVDGDFDDIDTDSDYDNSELIHVEDGPSYIVNNYIEVVFGGRHQGAQNDITEGSSTRRVHKYTRRGVTYWRILADTDNDTASTFGDGTIAYQEAIWFYTGTETNDDDIVADLVANHKLIDYKG